VWWRALVAAGALLVCSACAGSGNRTATDSERTPTEIIAATSIRSTVLISTQMVQGTGFAIQPGVIATSFHVVAGENRISIRDASGGEHPVAGIRSYDEVNDLAILHVPSASIAPLKLGLPAAPPIGSPVVVVSNPLGYQGSITTGVVSALRSEGVQLDAAIAPGSSGAPVLDRKGFVIGVMRQTTAGAQNLNFAVPVGFLRRLVASTSDAVTPLGAFAEATRRSRTRIQAECSLFTNVVNEGLFEISQVSAAASPQTDVAVRHVQHIARVYEQLRGRIQALTLVSDLAKLGEEYRAVCATAATAARGLAVAIQAEDAAKADAAAKDLKAIERREDSLVDAINAYCKF
jgi:S1-C subfamily serine protease